MNFSRKYFIMPMIMIYCGNFPNCDTHIKISSCEAPEEYKSYTVVFSTVFLNHCYKISYNKVIQYCENKTCTNRKNNVFKTTVNSSHIDILIYNVTRADDQKDVSIVSCNKNIQESQVKCILMTFAKPQIVTSTIERINDEIYIHVFSTMIYPSPVCIFSINTSLQESYNSNSSINEVTYNDKLYYSINCKLSLPISKFKEKKHDVLFTLYPNITETIFNIQRVGTTMCFTIDLISGTVSGSQRCHYDLINGSQFHCRCELPNNTNSRDSESTVTDDVTSNSHISSRNFSDHLKEKEMNGSNANLHLLINIIEAIVIFLSWLVIAELCYTRRRDTIQRERDFNQYNVIDIRHEEEDTNDDYMTHPDMTSGNVNQASTGGYDSIEAFHLYESVGNS